MAVTIPNAIAYSPHTTLASGCDTTTATEAEITDLTAFSDVAAGELGIIVFCAEDEFRSVDAADFETMTYTSKNAGTSELEGLVHREGTARTWPSGTYVACYGTAWAWEQVQDAITELYDSENIVYDGTSSGLTATDVQTAIDEVDSNIDTHVAEDETDDVHGYKTYIDGLINTEYSELALQWDQGSDSYMRIADAMYLTRSEFSEYYPLKGMRRCMMEDNGDINYYIDPVDPTKIGEVVNTGSYTEGNAADYTGGDGQVMVEIPRFYYKVDKSGDVYRWFIAATDDAPLSEQPDGYSIHPAFVRDSVEKDHIYFSAFEGNVADEGGTDKMQSVSGVQPSTETNVTGGDIEDFRAFAQARGTGWEQQLFLPTCAVLLLYLVEYASYDTQSEIGRGVVDKASGTGNESINTGDTISLGNASGADDGTDGLVSISYRGIENLWGNIYKWVDGFNIKGDYEVWVADHDYDSDLFAHPYEQMSTDLLSSSDTYAKDIIHSASFDYSFLPSVGGGNSSSYLCDNYWVASGNRVARFGGTWSNDSRAGGFCWILSHGSASSGRSTGSRLLYIP